VPKILLVYPPSKTQFHQSCPMGIQLLAAVLEKEGHQVILLDANAARAKLSSSQIVERAVHIRPDVIGMTLLTPMIREAYGLTQKLKQMGFRLLAGGPHATLMPKEAVNNGFDAAVIGEGESAIQEAVLALTGQIDKRDVPGWAYREQDGSVVLTAPRPLIGNLDKIPLPARHLIEPHLYGEKDNPLLHTNLFSSRGCPAKCSFCSGHLFGKKFRFRSAQNMLDEIEYIHTNYGTKQFHFVDDAMTLHKKRLVEFCEGLTSRRLPVEWSVMTRIDAVDQKFLGTIRQAGCVSIEYGVESGHPETLKRIHKPHTVEMVKEVIPLTAQMGIQPSVFFILGFPWEDVAALQNTHNLMKDISPYVSEFHPAVASIIIPFPGTELYEQYCHEYGFENWWLSEEKNYDRLVPEDVSYYESKVFRLGSILKADFFKYDQRVKGKILEIFEFMHFHNLSNRRSHFSAIQRNLIGLSKTIETLSPGAERLIFSPIRFVESNLKRQYH
jgi:anaerobic magnesium-protoporphyrin IX monomethyl ester cyclase